MNKAIQNAAVLAEWEKAIRLEAYDHASHIEFANPDLREEFDKAARGINNTDWENTINQEADHAN